MNKVKHNQIESLKNKVISLESEVQSLREVICLLKRKRFGSSSEKVPQEQLGLFDEVENIDLSEDSEVALPEDEVAIDNYKRKKRGHRVKLPEHLPRVDNIIDIDSKVCPEDGSELKCIGEDISERLNIIPAKVEVIRTIRKKYSCPCCEEVHTGLLPLELLPKTNSSPSLLSHIAVSKYADALPLYRQEKIFKRIEMDLPRQTMARWMIRVGEKIAPIINLLKIELLKSHYIHMDETTVQVLKEDGKRAQSKSYMWVMGRSGKIPIIIFSYGKNRSSNYPVELLENYSQALQVDGYDGYQKAITANNMTRLGCWAHARRKFFDAFKSSRGKSVGAQGIKFVKKLYEIEKQIRDHPNRFVERLNRSIPILYEFKNWLQEKKSKITPDSLAGKAIKYTLNEWEYLANCFAHSDFELDNNFIEGHIRPFAIGRKNWMFSVKPEGAIASGNIYSLIETAKANDIDPFVYLKNLFEKLPYAKSEDDLRSLLPLKLTG